MRPQLSTHFTTRLRSVVALATAASFFFTTVGTPVAEANFWQERRDAAQRANGKGDLYAQLPGSLRVENALPAIQGALGQALSSPKLGEISAAVAASVRPSDVPSWLRHLPSVNGEIRRVALVKNADKNPAVVILQDVHDVPSAQKNIAQVLSHIETAAKGQEVLIGVEGAVGAFGIKPYRSLRGFEGHRIACDILLDSHLIAAPEYHGFQSEKEPLLWGVETPADYIENVEAYRASRPLVEDVNKKLADAARALEKKDDVLSPALLKVETAIRAYAGGKLSFADYIRTLSGQVPMTEQGAETAKLVRALDMESRLDFRQVERERGVLVETLVNKLDRKSIESLVESSLAYRAGRKTYGSYYGELKTLAAGKGVNWENFPAFEKYVDYVLISESIDKFALFDQVEGLKNQAVQATARTAAERDYAVLAEDIRLLTRLVKHEFGPAEWNNYQARRLNLTEMGFRLSRALGENIPAPSGDQLEVFERFYRAADKRNQSLTDNLLAKVKEEKSQVVALIAGGFHTPALETLLEKAGLSVITVTPRVEEIPAGANYLDFFTAKHIPLEEMFAGKKLYLSPPHGLAQVQGVGGAGNRSMPRVRTGFAAVMVAIALGMTPSAQVEAAQPPIEAEAVRQQVQGDHGVSVVVSKMPQGFLVTAEDHVAGILRIATVDKGVGLRAVAEGSGSLDAETLYEFPNGRRVDVVKGRPHSSFDTFTNGLFSIFGLLAFPNAKALGRRILAWVRSSPAKISNLFMRSKEGFLSIGERTRYFVTPFVLSFAARLRSWGVSDPLKETIDRGVDYWEGRIATGPVMQKFRPSRQEDIPFVADMTPLQKRALVERGLSEYREGKGVVGVLAAGAASRMNMNEAPPTVLAMLERMYGRGEKTTVLSKAAVPVVERKRQVYSFLGLFMTNVARMEEAVRQATAGQAIPNQVSILTTDEYKPELDHELKYHGNYGVKGPIRTPMQELGAQYVATPADVEKLQKKLGDNYETARDLSVSVHALLEKGERSAVILPNEKAPLGHGEYFHQMVESGDLLDYIESGVRWLYIRNVDNSAALLDEDFLAMLGIFVSEDLDFLAEVSPREAGMKGGALIVSDKAQTILTEGPSFQATWDRLVEDLAEKGFTPITNGQEKRKAVADIFRREKTMRVEPSRMDFEGGSYSDEDAAWRAVSEGHVEPFKNNLTNELKFVRHVHPESTYWFNNASGFFRPKYLYFIYRKGPNQTYDQFVQELRRARSSANRRNEIAARGRSRFPTLVDPKPARTQAAVAVKFETNMWQGTQVAAEAGARLGAAGVYSLKNLQGMADDDRVGAKKSLRFLATKQWTGPAESYEANRDFVDGILDRILGELFPDNIHLPPLESKPPRPTGWRRFFPMAGVMFLLAFLSPDLFAQTMETVAGTAGFSLSTGEMGILGGLLGMTALATQGQTNSRAIFHVKFKSRHTNILELRGRLNSLQAFQDYNLRAVVFEPVSEKEIDSNEDLEREKGKDLEIRLRDNAGADVAIVRAMDNNDRAIIIFTTRGTMNFEQFLSVLNGEDSVSNARLTSMAGESLSLIATLSALLVLPFIALWGMPAGDVASLASAAGGHPVLFTVAFVGLMGSVASRNLWGNIRGVVNKVLERIRGGSVEKSAPSSIKEAIDSPSVEWGDLGLVVPQVVPQLRDLKQGRAQWSQQSIGMGHSVASQATGLVDGLGKLPPVESGSPRFTDDSMRARFLSALGVAKTKDLTRVDNKVSNWLSFAWEFVAERLGNNDLASAWEKYSALAKAAAERNPSVHSLTEFQTGSAKIIVLDETSSPEMIENALTLLESYVRAANKIHVMWGKNTALRVYYTEEALRTLDQVQGGQTRLERIQASVDSLSGGFKRQVQAIQLSIEEQGLFTKSRDGERVFDVGTAVRDIFGDKPPESPEIQVIRSPASTIRFNTRGVEQLVKFLIWVMGGMAVEVESDIDQSLRQMAAALRSA